MKKNKKIFILIILLITFTASCIVFGASVKINSTTVKKINGDEQEIKVGNNVTLKNDPHNYDTTVNSILQQYNIWCTQNKKDLDGEYSYSVVGHYTSKDPVLNYIINKGPSSGKRDPYCSTQIALWFYLADDADYGNTSDPVTDKARLLNGYRSPAPELGQGIYHVEDGVRIYKWGVNAHLTEGRNMYEAAKRYAEGIKNMTNPTITTTSFSEDNKKLIVKGNSAGYSNSNLKFYLVKTTGRTETETAIDATFGDADTGKYIATLDISSITDSTIKVKVKGKYSKYELTYWTLKSGSKQRLMVTNIAKQDDAYPASPPVTVVLKTDVSLQKYITKVNGVDLTNADTQLTDRHAKMAYAEKDGHKKNIKNYHGETTTVSDLDCVEGKYKKANPVMIEPGDTVTYYINVYNNSSIIAQKVHVYDTLDLSLIDTNSILVRYGGKGSKFDTYEEFGEDSSKKNYEIKDIYDEDGVYKGKVLHFQINKLKSCRTAEIMVTVKYNKYSSDPVRNRAWINKTEPDNKETYRTDDSDYVKMKDYSVSLEKYVSKVEDEDVRFYAKEFDYNDDGCIDEKDFNVLVDLSVKDKSYIQNYISEHSDKIFNINGDKTSDGEDKINSSDALLLQNLYNGGRANHPKYSPNSFSKEDNPVELEVGDTVTYTIKLTNTGETVIKVTEITDTFDSSTLKGLEYIDGSIEGYGTIRKERETTAGDKKTLTFTIENPAAIAPEESVKITLKFKANANESVTAEKQKLENSATVTKIINKYDIDVPDSDGEANNTDSDWVETKLYKVSLEKVVNRINDELILNLEYDYNNDNIVDEKDAEILALYSVGELTELPTDKKTDVNEDGIIDSFDHGELLKMLRLSHPTYRPEGFSKEDNPVELEVGDKVEYTIRIKNTGETEIKPTTIIDEFEWNDGKYGLQLDERAGIKGYGEGIYEVTKEGNKITLNIDKTDNEKLSRLETIQSGESKYITITFNVEVAKEFTKEERIIKNTATVTQLVNRHNLGVLDSDGEENNTDSDWVKTKLYKVSLEKYVTKVESNDGSFIEVAERENHPTYNENGFEKDSNPVELEVGDTVTYTIKLTNTGETNIKVTDIVDTFDGNDKADLEYQRGTAVGYGDITVTQDETGKLNIKITNPPTIEPGESKYLTLKFKVNVERENTNVKQILVNTAEVTEIINKNNKEVLDSTEDDNKDSDWVITKLYKVSLEKYVSVYDVKYDYDDNGKIDEEDYRHFLNILSGYEIKKSGKEYDINGDTQINAFDYNIYSIMLRENKPTWSELDPTYKQDSPVKVEVGDTVTYTIKLTNTGDTNIKVTDIVDTFDGNDNADLEYQSGTAVGYGDITVTQDETGKLNIKITNPPTIEPGESKYLTLKFKVTVPFENTNREQLLVNTAQVTEIINKNDKEVLDSDGEENNIDSDWVITKLYKVSLEKYVSKVNGTDVTPSREGKAEHNYDDNLETWNNAKYNDVVTVSNGDEVTYTIKVKNDGDTKAIITNIADYFPNGVDNYTGDIYCTEFSKDNGKTGNIKNYTTEITLEPNAEYAFTVNVKVTEPNISVKILKNIAKIISLKNKNNIEVLDSTENNNEDADYIQLEFNEPQETVDFKVIKNWNLGEGSVQPAQVTVKLLKVSGSTEEDLGMESVVLSDANNWEYTWEELPKLEENWQYIARELDENGINLLPGGGNYNSNITVTYNDERNIQTTITNTGTDTETPPDTPPDNPPQELTSYTVEKVWQDEDNKDGVRPNSVKVRLFKKQGNDLKRVDGKEDKELNNGNWTFTWNDLPKYDGENLIEYIAIELKGNKKLEEGDKLDDNYTVSYKHEVDKTTIYNTKPEKPDESPDTSDDMAIAGMVWNDMALDKTENNYNSVKDEQESYLSGITVMLYREGKGKIATTTTNENGEYRFTNEDLSANTSLANNEKYIKGPKVNGVDRWVGTYYDYYVIFEYDGVTYTSTTNCWDWWSDTDYKINSNASENQGKVSQTRENFNGQFGEIEGNKVSGNTGEHNIEYSTVNEEGFVPQSIYKYDSSWMAIQSSTSLIDLSNKANSANTEELKKIQEHLNHIDLGLKGRDVFDLELTSDVYSTKVTVNDVEGDYNYNNNKVTVRRNDCNNYNYREDSRNIYYEDSYYKGEEYDQRVRQSDITNDIYGNTGLEIKVTYKITVKNASYTNGTATKITNYYDNKYEFERAYVESEELLTANGTSGEGYKSIVITTPATELRQSDKMDIYVVYKLQNPVDLLKDLRVDERLATYNMAEITAYKTTGTGVAATRGLLDKDSAPGSVTTEKVRLTPDKIGTVSTIEYYFAKQNLNMLKYEDDTYATPTLYFVKDGSTRTITGTVFEDKTTVNSDTKVKTGNGKLDEGEVGVYGATVQLIEQVDGGKVRYEESTDTSGKFEFSDFLPGKYIIKYSYGDTVKTALLHQSDDSSVNNKSYNGEDFQATNNGLNSTADNKPNPSLNTTPDYWYLYNEGVGISTATDDKARRINVSNAVADFTDDQMTVLNNMKAGKTAEECKSGDINVDSIIETTKMWATTQEMFFDVEKTEPEGSDVKKSTTFGEYNITDMNFGIAEIPVTNINLQKTIQAFTITDSVGQNTIAKLEFAEGKPKTKGDVTTAAFAGGNYWAQIEDEKLQGARLEITFNIKETITNELNFDGTSSEIAHITGLVDFISNNLSYNEKLGDNEKYWELTTFNEVKENLKLMKFESDTTPEGTVDPEGENYSVILKAKTDNPLLLTTEGEANATITLEKVLTSTGTIEDIVEVVSDSTVYSNIVEITGFQYQTTEIEQPDGTKKSAVLRDRIRTTKVIDDIGTTTDFIILPGKQYDSASSEELIITPPTGDTSISTIYLIITVISLAVLGLGTYGIKKYVIKK